MWQADGGRETLEDFRKLPVEEREGLLDYLDEFAPYDVAVTDGNRFILMHGGIPYTKKNLPLDRQSVSEMITERPDYSKRYYNTAYLVTGHTPTLHIGEEYRGRIYRGNGHIAIDCGAGYGLPLGCIRLEDFAEFYVE